jgi:hypothetical protein
MNATEVKSFVSAYGEFVRTPIDAPRSGALFWTFDLLVDVAEKDPELCWRLIEAVVSRDSDEQVLAALAAGPMEDLLARHGQAFIERIESRAGQNPLFRHLLAGVWRNDIPQDIWDRVVAARGAGNGKV